MTQVSDDFRALIEDGHGPKIRALIERTRPSSNDVFFRRLRTDLLKAIRRLERKRHHIHFSRERGNHEGEEQLTGRIVDILDAMSYQVEAEPDVNGHADIAVRIPNTEVDWLAECKIWGQISKLEEGMLQLHDRYSSGNCADSAFIIFCFLPNARSVLDNWRSHLLTEKICDLQGVPTEIDSEFSFETSHINKVSGSPLVTWHVVGKFFYDPQDNKDQKGSAKKKSAKKGKA